MRFGQQFKIHTRKESWKDIVVDLVLRAGDAHVFTGQLRVREANMVQICAEEGG